MNIFEYFKKKGIDTIDSSFYSKIAMWDSWYRSNVRKFHQFRVYRGSGQYERCHRKSLGMAKKICEDISDLLLNERVTITIKDATTAEYVRSVLDAANFTVQGNEYQERKAACGTVAYVPYLTNTELDDQGRIISADVKLDYQSLQAMSSFMRFSICAIYCTLSLLGAVKIYAQIYLQAPAE